MGGTHQKQGHHKNTCWNHQAYKVALTQSKDTTKGEQQKRLTPKKDTTKKGALPQHTASYDVFLTWT